MTTETPDPSAGAPRVVAVVGIGLIGGSVALAARERLGAVVRGWDPSPEVRAEALRRNVLDEAAATLADAVADAEIAVVAAPVAALPGLVAEVLAHAPAQCTVTDVGSTKREVAGSTADPRFIGGHPLAGAETAGVAHARADLFADATWYLTPTAAADGVRYEALHRFVAGLGAKPEAIDPEAHDRLLGSVSHVPHVLANVLVAGAAATLAADGERLPAAGPSFRDATRVAGANSAIWTDIYLSNADVLVGQLDDAIARLHEVRGALAARDATAIAAWNDAAREDRRRLLETGLAGGEVHELRASVPNRAGVIAEVALALGRAGVDIADMALYPSRGDGDGSIALWLTGAAAADRAQEIVAALGFPVARA